MTDAGTRTVTAVRDGLGVVWSMDWLGYASEADEYAGRALAAAAAAGVTPVA